MLRQDAAFVLTIPSYKGIYTGNDTVFRYLLVPVRWPNGYSAGQRNTYAPVVRVQNPPGIMSLHVRGYEKGTMHDEDS